MRLISLIPLLLLACNNDKDGAETGGVDSGPVTDDSGAYDQDGDGYGPDDDCDDTDFNVNPGAEEICDLIDNDCDGTIDDGAVDAGAWTTDADGDGYGDDATAVISCAQPAGTTATGGDCDDADPAVNPGAAEQCDLVDNDCDGEIDEDVVGAWYADGDGDGYGDPADALDTCNPPDGYVADGTDCDDATASTHPSADELCNEVDDDCDGEIDEDAVDEGTWYSDADGDGHGDPDTASAACAQPEGASATGDDCDDTNAEIYPDAGEQCDGLDNDCDDTIDEDVISTWYTDADGDGHGDPDSVLDDCDPPEGYASVGDDCDDAVETTYPGADELCNEVDDDCDGSTDEEATDATTWYSDADGDGYGDPDSAVTGTCDSPGDGFVANALDCDDSDAEISPDASEVCNGLDDDCDGSTDEDAIDGDTWYADADEDGYGDPLATATACDQPDGYLPDDSDCDDLDATINPDAEELCDTLDNDCDGLVDDEATDGDLWYYDDDADGYGVDDDTIVACEQPDSYVATSGDCDDVDAAINPDAAEVCDGVDNDCDGSIDDGASDASTWYVDADEDGYGDATGSVESCDAPDGYAATGDDCDDADPAYNPGALEDDCSDPNDYNCDGSTGYADDDGDGYAACEDCDDTNEDVSPSGVEVCNGLDDDCDGAADNGASDLGTWYADADGDTYGDATDSVESCDAPTGYVLDDSDCDDASSASYPGATEICDDLDNDCDGSIDEDAAGALDWYADADGDGFGDAAETTSACDQPSGYSSDNTDCDDTTSAANPDASEVCDEIDNDCDGSADEEDATDAGTWYRDADNDYYGDPDDSVRACDRPSGYRRTAKDCDDTDASVHPKADETCNDVDDDCDSVIDENPTDAADWYADGDGDGFGDPLTTTAACDQPSGYLSDDQDCDDADGGINPDATEVCDGVDNDCDGTIDDGGADVGTWYADLDGDGYGDPDAPSSGCEQPAGTVDDASDCDDLDGDINPDAAEICDGVDNDCDGATDGSDATDQSTWYEDADEDGYGGSTTTTACDQPAGYVDIDGDCDDDDARYNPGAAEACTDRNDYNCDGSTGYADADGDGTAACEDCDDDNAAAWPGATETCDGADNDCDGDIDESGAVGEDTWYADADADGYGDEASSVEACDAPGGYVSDATDCDDGDADVHPDAIEICDGEDDDCDGTADDNAADASTWYRDRDRDDFGDAGVTTSSCSQPSGYVADDEDCDDTDGDVNPDADELCDGVDNDCDGATDESDATDADTWYADDDADGFGDPTSTTLSCAEPSGYTAAGADPDDNDCDDTDGDVNPDATEVCDEIDNDCDGDVDEDDAADAGSWYYDDDGDGYGDDAITTTACDAPTDYVEDGDDCDDADSDINPGETDVCDGVDNDCSGYVDDGEACGGGCEVEYYSGGTYLFCTTAASWTTGQSTCNSLGYDMVSMGSSAENVWVRDMSVTYSSTSTKWWIGLNDISTEGSFVWESGEAVTYTNWASGEPNNVGNEDCTQLNRFSDYTWNDEPCSSSFRYICEL